MLKRHEGYKLKPYKCPAGKNTIGVGHNFDANPLPKDMQAFLDLHGQITESMAEALLSADIDNAVKDCRKLYPNFNGFSQRRKDALTDFLFNVGIGTAREFKNTNKYINLEQWDKAAVNMGMSKWFSQVKSRGPEIVQMIREG